MKENLKIRTESIEGYVALIEVNTSKVIVYLKEGTDELSSGFVSGSSLNNYQLHSYTLASPNIIGKYVYIDYFDDLEENRIDSIRIADTYVEVI